jgi:hypothetical protein
VDEFNPAPSSLLQQDLGTVSIDSHAVLNELPADMDMRCTMDNHIKRIFKYFFQAISIGQIPLKNIDIQALEGTVL